MKYDNKFLIVLFLLCSQYMMSLSANLSEMFTIFSMYLKKPCEVGELVPMSYIVGKELTKYVDKMSQNSDSSPKYYLEAGGGCGAISVCIAEKLRPCDHLDVIEINPELCVVLSQRLKNYINIKVHCCSILDWHPDYQYDAIISTLPFLSLGVDFAKKTMQLFRSVALKNCIISCVEYPIAVVFRKVMRNLRLKDADFVAVQTYMAFIRKQFLKESTTIYYNMPPINVYHLSFDF